MKKFFSRNGVSIPSIGLGTWDLRHKEGEDVIKLAIEAGYRHIDTAQMYENEEAVGNAIYNSNIARDKFFITTKIYTLVIKNDEIDSSFNKSLQKLKNIKTID